MSLFKNPFKRPDELWEKTEDGIQLTYPIFCFDSLIPNDPIIKLTIKDICNDVDFWGWQWGDQERIIDSSGKVFYPRYEISGHWRSGVFPGKVERETSVSEVKDIMKQAIETRAIRLENKTEILSLIDTSETIGEVLKNCHQLF